MAFTVSSPTPRLAFCSGRGMTSFSFSVSAPLSPFPLAANGSFFMSRVEECAERRDKGDRGPYWLVLLWAGIQVPWAWQACTAVSCPHGSTSMGSSEMPPTLLGTPQLQVPDVNPYESALAGGLWFHPQSLSSWQSPSSGFLLPSPELPLHPAWAGPSATSGWLSHS